MQVVKDIYLNYSHKETASNHGQHVDGCESSVF